MSGRPARTRLVPHRTIWRTFRQITFPQLLTLMVLLLGQLALSRNARRTGGGQAGGMAGMIAEQR